LKASGEIDLGICSNLRAALELARTAFGMSGDSNRRAAASQAINRLLEAEHQYIGLVDIEFTNGGWSVSPLLSAHTLATVSAARCYLELGELETAKQHLSDGAAALEPRVQRYYESIIGVNPAIFLHYRLAPEISLKRLAGLLQRDSPGITELNAFEKLRQPIWETAMQSPEPWIKKLPLALWNHAVDGETKIGPVKRRRSSQEILDRLLPRLPDAFSQVEQAHVSIRCVRGFESELQFLLENNIGYAEWQQLTQLPAPNSADTILCLIPEWSELLAIARIEA
jgi:hypothetical protein